MSRSCHNPPQSLPNHHQLFETLTHKPSERERRWAVQGELQEGLALAGRLNKIHKSLLYAYPPAVDGDEEGAENARHQKVMEWAAQLADQVRALAEPPLPNHVRYCEEQPGQTGPASIALYNEPLQVADFLRETLFEPVKRVVCTKGPPFDTTEHLC